MYRTYNKIILYLLFGKVIVADYTDYFEQLATAVSDENDVYSSFSETSNSDSSDTNKEKKENVETAYTFLSETGPRKNHSNTSDEKDYSTEYERSLTTPQIIKSYGFHVQIHEVATEDGFILTIHRIISNFQYVVTNTSKVILFHHGLFGNSADWLLGGSDSLPFLLARQGYDVWLANARGSIYSRSHIKYSTKSDDFWNFSFDEIGRYDLPPVLYYIKTVTGSSSKLYFIGHSMGATAFLVTMSMVPRCNALVKMAVLMAPMAYLQRISGPVKRLATMDHSLLWSQLGNREIPQENILFRMLHKEFCGLQGKMCDVPLIFLTNGGRTIQGTEILEMAAMRRHSECSTKTLMHYLQMLQSGSFKEYEGSHYDEGFETEYVMDRVVVPLIVFSSDDDALAPTWDVVSLATRVPNILVHHTVSDFSHMDFVWGINASRILYNNILIMLDNQEMWF